jgi:flagellar hook-basal body complex protein FliE
MTIEGLIVPSAPVGPAPAASDAGASRRASAAAAAQGADFGAMLGQVAADAVGAVKNAEALSIAGIRGKASVQQVVEAVMSAEQTLQGALAIRDKAVSAYLELSRMSI